MLASRGVTSRGSVVTAPRASGALRVPVHSACDAHDGDRTGDRSGEWHPRNFYAHVVSTQFCTTFPRRRTIRSTLTIPLHPNRAYVRSRSTSAISFSLLLRINFCTDLFLVELAHLLRGGR